MNLGFCEKIKVTWVPPGRPRRRTVSGTHTTGWKPLLYKNS